MSEEQQIVDGDANDFFEKVGSLLEKLVPPSKVTITTADGSSLELPGAIPARRQVTVFRMMRELLDLPQVGSTIEGMSGQIGAGNMVDVVIALSTDEEVMELLGKIFSEAYPTVLGEGVDPLDVLPIEEVVSALVPFTERFIKRLGRGLVALGSGASTLA